MYLFAFFQASCVFLDMCVVMWLHSLKYAGLCYSQLQECAESVCVKAGIQVWNPNLDELKFILHSFLLYWPLAHFSSLVS